MLVSQTRWTLSIAKRTQNKEIGLSYTDIGKTIGLARGQRSVSQQSLEADNYMFKMPSMLNLKIMKIHSLSKIAPLLVMMQFSLTMYAQGISDSIAIQSILQEEVVSWNKGDAKIYSQHFAKDGTFTNILGIFFIGHAEFLSRHEQIFKGVFSGTTLKQDLISLKFVDKDVAVVETLVNWIFKNKWSP